MPNRLLLIDDEPTGLLAVAEGLKARLPDTVVDTAVNTHAALSLLHDHQYHVVLSDIRMAGLDGLILLKQVRERWPDTPVLLMTAGGPEKEPEALRNGAFAFIEKPVDLDRLVALLQVAMEKSLFRERVRDANRQSTSRLNEIEANRMGLDYPLADKSS
jgi:DNA-binding NtrC family response regulator